MMTLKQVSKLPVKKVNAYLDEGARFVRFSYAISVIVISFKQYSDVYFVRKD